MILRVLMVGKVDILNVDADILSRIAKEVVFTDISRLEDGIQWGEDAEAGVDCRQVRVEVT